MGVALFVMVVVVVLIYFLVEFKRMRHKIFALFLIGLIILSYVSVIFIFKGQDVDLKTIPGIISATRLYFSWMGGVFGNMRDITANVIKMDWGTNKTTDDFSGPIVKLSE